MRRLREGNKRAAAKGTFPRIRWEGYGHHDLYNMIHATSPKHLHDMAGGWRTLGKSIGETTKAVQKSLNKLSANWLGAASVQARQSTEKITRWADELADKTREIGDGLHQYADAVHHAQRVIPPPEFAYAESSMMHGDPFSIVSGPAGRIEIAQLIDDQKPNFEKHHEAYQEAIRVMKNYGVHSQTVHDEMPSLPPAPPPRSPTPTQAGPLPWTVPIPTPIPKPTPEPKPRDDDPAGSGGPSMGSDDGTTAAAVDPTKAGFGWGNQPGTGPGYGLDSTRGGGQGTGFGVGSGFTGGPGAYGASGEGPAGRAGAGPLSARGAGEFGARGAAGLGGARGAGGPGAGSFYPPVAGGGAPGEDDQEHKDKYNDGLDLFDDLPPAYPPVFGA
jgi:uncharacterized protein YukE